MREPAVLVPLFPLLGAALVAIGRSASARVRAAMGVAPLVVSFVGALLILGRVPSQGPVVVRFTSPGAVSSLILPVSFRFDRLSSVMMVLITGIGTLIYLFSLRYMQDERNYGRFLAVMLLTIAVLLCMVSSANLLMLLVCWQMLTPLLYLLAHRHEHEPTLVGAFTTFTLLRVADMALLAGVVLAQALYGTVEFEELVTRAAANPGRVALWPGMGLEISGVTAVTLFLFVGAMGKSAQVPLHLWLPGYLYAPTPVSALLHAGIINAGGFLLNRLAPLFSLSPLTLHVAFVVGLLTAILGACMMLIQNDIKKTLGFSTIGQMGYMIMECGLGAFALAIFHLMAHGLFKATMFLNCGQVIHLARKEWALPHGLHELEARELPRPAWATGFLTTLLLPLIILLVSHGVLEIPLLESQGTVIFLFFAWVTSSQAILTLTRLRAVASWKVSLAMLLTLLLVVSTYLFAAEAFTAFLYPNPGDVAALFSAAALPGWLFDGLVVAATGLVVLGWVVVYASAHEHALPIPGWVDRLRIRLYVVLMNRLYLDALYFRVGQAVWRLAKSLDPVAWGQRP